jgi:membrane protease YdiL (CAAX protease family)
VTAQPAVREATFAWAAAFALLLLAFLTYRPAAPLVATAAFLYVPLALANRRGEDLGDYGLSLRNWREDLRLFLICAAVIAPLYFAASWAFYLALPHLPTSIAQRLFPVQRPVVFAFRLPHRFWAYAIEQLLVVALPEELFYRGFLQTRLDDAWPPRVRVLGARVGASLVVTSALFALGHLAIFEFWRLSVFFPALLFGWLRERTGTIAGSTLLHAFSNVFQRLVEAWLIGL